MNIKKHKLVILLATLLYILSITLLLLYVKNLNTNKYKPTYNITNPITINTYSNEELNIVTLEQVLFKKRLYHLDSIYSHINNLYNTQYTLYTKGIGNKNVVKILAIEKNMALQAINNYKKKQLKKISGMAKAYIQ